MPAERPRLPARLRRAVDRDAVPAEPDEAHCEWFEPLDEAFDSLGSGAILVVGELGGAWCRTLDEVGHADAVSPQRVHGVVGAGDNPGLERGGPEPVAAAGEPVASEEPFSELMRSQLQAVAAVIARRSSG